jgi:hypothetical protein
MSDPKPFASLSPTLLARKGGAKPAMRRQVHYPDSLARAVLEDDLGWNDMGDEDFAVPVAASAGEVVPIKAQVELPADPVKPAVIEHQEAIARQVIAPAQVAPPAPAGDSEQGPSMAQAFAAMTAARPASIESSAKPRRSALDNGRRAAFTLRMDAERHLKLRLACTIRNRSAQQLMTEALDRLIDELPDLATLAAQVAERR